MARKAITNEKNPKDHIGRAGHTVLEKHKGKIAKPVPKMKTQKVKGK